MVEPDTPKPDADGRSSAAPTQAPWPADSPLDPAVDRFRGAVSYQVWRRGAAWTAVADGMPLSAVLVPRLWMLRERLWWQLAVSALSPAVAGAVVLAGAPAWSPVAWAVLLGAEITLRGCVARRARYWRMAVLQRNGWQPVTRLRAISLADAVTTARIRAGWSSR